MRDQRANDARDALRAKREHSKGDGNFPDARPHGGLEGETPRDPTPEDLPKERDDRTAPKGDMTNGQRDRNPDLEVSADRLKGPQSVGPSPSAAGRRAPEQRE